MPEDFLTKSVTPAELSADGKTLREPICVTDFSRSSRPEEPPGEMGDVGDEDDPWLRKATVGMTEKGWFSQGRRGARVGKYTKTCFPGSKPQRI